MFMSLAVVVVLGSALYYLRPILVARPASSQSTSATLLPTSDTLTSYDFMSASLGWALEVTETPSNQGPFWVFRTVDGAKHWQRQLMGQTSSVGLTLDSFQFLDPTHGFVAVGNPISLYRTTDGGMHWLALGLPYSDGYAVTFTDPRHGWFLGWTTVNPSPNQVPHLSSTNDGGNTWEQLPDPPLDSNGVTFRTPLEGWMGSNGVSQPHVYLSVDGGHSWQRREVPLPSGDLPNSMLSTNVLQLPGAGVIASLNLTGPGAQFTSFDGGTSWSKVAPLPLGVGGGDLGFQDNLHWWEIYVGALYKSSDAGQTWIHISDKLPNAVYSLHILDSKHAWAQVFFTDGSGLAFTADGGLTWARAYVPQRN
jgi:photosystem II stability/assembly factor-like uncharacterized protein